MCHNNISFNRVNIHENIFEDKHVKFTTKDLSSDEVGASVLCALP